MNTGNATTLVDSVRNMSAGVAVLKLKPKNEPLTKEAHAWMTDENAIPACGYRPIQYIGWKKVDEIAEILGHPITLEEAHHLVQPDGKTEICPATGVTFQPVKYWPFTPKSLKDDLDAGKKIFQIDLPYGGAFFLQRGKIIPFSGSVFEKTGLEIANGSPLIMAAKVAAKARGSDDRYVWGKCREVLENYLRERSAKREQHRIIQGRIEEIFFPTNPSREPAKLKLNVRRNGHE